jgi:hypothetical protein
MRLYKKRRIDKKKNGKMELTVDCYDLININHGKR